MVSENVRSDIRAIDEELVWLADVLDWNYCSIKALVKAETQNTAWTLYERVGVSTSELSTILHEWETEEHFGFKAARVVEACIEMKVVAGEALKVLAYASSEQILLTASLVEASWDTAACAAGMIVTGANVKPGSGEAAELAPIRRAGKNV